MNMNILCLQSMHASRQMFMQATLAPLSRRESGKVQLGKNLNYTIACIHVHKSRIVNNFVVA